MTLIPMTLRIHTRTIMNKIQTMALVDVVLVHARDVFIDLLNGGGVYPVMDVVVLVLSRITGSGAEAMLPGSSMMMILVMTCMPRWISECLWEPAGVVCPMQTPDVVINVILLPCSPREVIPRGMWQEGGEATVNHVVEGLLLILGVAFNVSKTLGNSLFRQFE